MAYMNNADEPELFLKSKDDAKRRLDRKVKAEKLLAELQSHWPKSTEEKKQPEFEASFNTWYDKQKANIVQWQTIVPESMSTNVTHLTQEPDGVIFASGDITKADTYTLKFSGAEYPVRALRLEALPDVRLPQGGPGLTYYEGRKGDFFLNEIEATDDVGKKIDWRSASATFAGNTFGGVGGGGALSIDGDVQSGWSTAGQSGFRNVAVFNFADPLPAGKPFTITMKFGRHFASSLGKFRFSVVESDRELEATILEGEVSDQRARELFLCKPAKSKNRLTRYAVCCIRCTAVRRWSCESDWPTNNARHSCTTGANTLSRNRKFNHDCPKQFLLTVNRCQRTGSSLRSGWCRGTIR